MHEELLINNRRFGSVNGHRFAFNSINSDWFNYARKEMFLLVM